MTQSKSLLTVHQSARKLLERMKLRAAARMAESYAEQADPSSLGRKHWREVADLLHTTHAFETNRIYDQAEKDDKEMTQKHAKRQAIPRPTTTPADAATAQPHTEARKERTPVEELARALRFKLDAAVATVSQFRVRMTQDDVASALEWSLTTFEAAARVRVFGQVLSAITDDEGNTKPTIGDDNRDSVDWVRVYATEEVLRRSRYSSQERSTSTTANLMEREYLAAWADVIEIIKWRI